MRPLLPVLALSLLLAACGTTATGTPAPVTSTASATPTPLPRVVLPPRPRDVDTAGVDVCGLLTVQQRAEFGFDSPVRNDYTAPFYDNNPVRGCSFTSFAPAQDAGLLISDRVGIEAWTTAEISATVKPDSVGGFPAITAIPQGHTDYCTVAVDLGPHVVLDVLFSDDSPKRTVPQSTLCERAHRTAELTMATLTQTLGR